MSNIDDTPRTHVRGGRPDNAVRPCGAELGCWIVPLTEGEERMRNHGIDIVR